MFSCDSIREERNSQDVETDYGGEKSLSIAYDEMFYRLLDSKDSKVQSQ